MMGTHGYMGKILRVNLTTGKISDEDLSEHMMEKYIGGSGFGAKYLYDEVMPGTEWDDPENRMILASGPVGGANVSGSGTFSIVSKGPMTNLAVTSQANGFFGAFLKFSGYDAVILQGKAPELVYLAIRDSKAELREAKQLKGKDTWETEVAIKDELGEGRRQSVFCIGPAGENRVRFALIAGDQGHVASKNGVGAVMGAKNLKAIAAYRGQNKINIKDREKLSVFSKKLLEHAKEDRGRQIYHWGTNGGFSNLARTGQLPVRNYTTNIFPDHEKMSAQYLRTHFEIKPKPCWACRIGHTKYVRVTEGPYTGYEGEEPEYECVAAWGPVIGNTDLGAVVMLSDLTDRLGLDVNEAGWVIAWVMECYEKGIFTKKQLDGLDMRWGNVEAVKEILLKISRREGCGALLAEGVKRASEHIGGEAPKMGIYTMKGATPRGHDHRARWFEMLDTCVSSTSTLEASGGSVPTQLYGMPAVGNSFSPWEVSTSNAKINGRFVFLDSLVLCRLCAIEPELTVATLNAVTGWGLTVEDTLRIGKRIINQLRIFNLRHGLDPATECPSDRYGSAPTDGPHEGKSIIPYWRWMVGNFYETMGWDKETGNPLPHTLRELGLEELIEDVARL